MEEVETPPGSLLLFHGDIVPVFSILEVLDGPENQLRSRSPKELGDLRFSIEVAGGIIMQTPFVRPEHNITLVFMSRDNTLNNVKFNAFHEMLEEYELFKDLFHENFIWEMVRTQALPDLNQFRLGTSHFEEYDANDILMKKLKWTDLTLKRVDIRQTEAGLGLGQNEQAKTASSNGSLQHGTQEHESISESEYFSAPDSMTLDFGKVDKGSSNSNFDSPPRTKCSGPVTRAMAARRSASMSPVSSASTKYFGSETTPPPRRTCSSRSPGETSQGTGGGRDFAANKSPCTVGETEILSMPLNPPAPLANVDPPSLMTRSKQAQLPKQVDEVTQKPKGRMRKPRKPVGKDQPLQEPDLASASTSAQADGNESNCADSLDSNMASLAVNSPSDRSSINTATPPTVQAATRTRIVVVNTAAPPQETLELADAGSPNTTTPSTPITPILTPVLPSSLTQKGSKSKEPPPPLAPLATQSQSRTIVSSMPTPGPSTSREDPRQALKSPLSIPISNPPKTTSSGDKGIKSKATHPPVAPSSTQAKSRASGPVSSNPGPSTSREDPRQALKGRQSTPISTPTIEAGLPHKHKSSKSKDPPPPVASCTTQPQSKTSVPSNSGPSTSREALNKTTVGAKQKPVSPNITTKGFFQKPAPVDLNISSKGKNTDGVPKPDKGQSTLTSWMARIARTLRDSPDSDRPDSPCVPQKRFRHAATSRPVSAESVCINWVKETSAGNVPPEDVPHINSEEEREASQHRSVSMSPAPEDRSGQNRVNNRAEEPREPSQEHRPSSMAPPPPPADRDGQTNEDSDRAAESRAPSHNSRQGQERLTNTKPPKADAGGWLGRSVPPTHGNSKHGEQSSRRNKEQPSTSLQAYSRSKDPPSIPPRHVPRDKSPPSPVELSTSSEESDYANFRRGSSVARSSSSVGPKKWITHAEKQIMVDWVCQHHDHDRIGSKSLYVEMEEANICPGRTFQTLSNSFRKNVVLNLDKFKMTDDDKKRFKRRMKGLRY